MKIVTISDSPTLYSGLARVHREVIDGFLAEGHSVLPCGWFAYNAEQLGQINKGKHVPPVIYESPHGSVAVLCVPRKSNMKSMYAISDVVGHVKPDVVVTIGDHWHFWYMRAVKIKAGFSFAWMPYLTIESDEIEDKWLRLLEYADAIAVPTEYGKRVLEPVCDRPIHVVEYGTSPAFRPLPPERRIELRRARGCEDKVRFITVAMNTWRKNLPAIPQAVKLICHRDPERRMRFYVHTNVDHTDPQETFLYDMRAIVSRLGVSDWFEFPDEDKTFSIYQSPGDDYLVDEYNASDFFVLPSTCEGYGLPICFTPDTDINTPMGTTRIEDIRVEDDVYSHTGSIKKVSATMRREYSGNLACIRAIGCNVPIKCTPEHPLLVVRKVFENSNDPRHMGINPTWLPAADVRKGDLLVVPIPSSPPTTHVVDLKDFIDVKGIQYDKEFVWSKYSNRPNGITARKISKATGSSMSSVHLVMTGKAKGHVSPENEANILAAMSTLGYESNCVVTTRRHVSMDARCARLLGLFAAEGSLSSAGASIIDFSFNASETSLHQDTITLMRDVLGITSYSKKQDPNRPNKFSLSFASICAARFFDKMVGHGARTKRLSAYIMGAPVEFKSAFLRGYWEGDGTNHDGTTSDSRSFATASKTMAWQVRYMLMQLGTFASISCSYREKTYKGTKRDLIMYDIRYAAYGDDAILDDASLTRYPQSRNINEKTRCRHFYRKSIMGTIYALAPIGNIHIEHYVGPVFNLEVEGDNSYCVNGFAAHNCEAMACGVPCIANATSMMPDHLGANQGQSYGRAARGFLVSNRMEIMPPCRFARIIRPDALGQAIWEAFLLARDEKERAELEGMRASCMEYGRRRSWADARRSLCRLAESLAGKTRVVVEEL